MKVSRRKFSSAFKAQVAVDAIKEAKWVNYLQKEKIGISMDGKGRALDNVFIERFWRTLKQDYVYMHPATDGTELFKGLRTFIHYYNNKKTHQGIERKRPIDLYQQAA